MAAAGAIAARSQAAIPGGAAAWVPRAGPPQAEAARSGDPGSRAGMPSAC